MKKTEKIVEFNFNLKIGVAIENIAEKYPNYRFNFNKTEDFVNFIISNLKQVNDIDLSNKGLEKFGYYIEVSSK